MTRLRTDDAAPISCSRAALLCGLFLTTALPAAAEPALSPTRFAPAKGLVAYVEYDGVGTHADAWKATAAYAMLRGTPAGKMTGEVTRQVIDRVLKDVPWAKVSGADLVALHDHIMTHGFSASLYDDGGGRASIVVVLNGVGRNPTRERLARLGRSLSTVEGAGEVTETTRFRGRVFYRMKKKDPVEPAADPLPLPPPPPPPAADEAASPAAQVLLGTDLPHVAPPAADEAASPAAKPRPDGETWWFEGDDLVLVEGQTAGKDAARPAAAGPDTTTTLPLRAAVVLDTIEGKLASVATHPGRAAALAEGQDIKGFEADGLFFFEAGKATVLFAGLKDGFTVPSKPYVGITLPAAPYLRDDVQYFPPAPDFPWANTQAATQRARMRAYGMEALTPAPAPTEPVAKVDSPEPAIPGPVGPTGDQSHAEPPIVPSEDPTPNPAADVADKKELVSEDLVAKFLGLDRITRVVGRWGFQGKALLTDVRVEAPAPHQGLLTVFDQPRFSADPLPPIPRNASSFLIGSFDPGRTYDALIDGFLRGEHAAQEEKIRKNGALKIGKDDKSTKKDLQEAGEPVNRELDEATKQEIEKFVRDATGLRLREDILSHLGPTWSVYLAPTPGQAEDDLIAPAFLVGVHDAGAFGKIVDDLATRANSYLRGAQAGDAAKADDDPPALALERLPAPERGYRLTSPGNLVSWLGDRLNPTILLGASHVVLASNPARARLALDAASRPAGRWSPAGELAEAFRCLPPGLTSLSVTDSSNSTWPETFSNLPKTVQFLANFVDQAGLDADKAPPVAGLLAVLGVPRPGGFRLKIDPASIPREDALRAHLFPSVLATAADDRGYRVISREAFPFNGFGLEYNFKTNSAKGAILNLGLKKSPFAGLNAELTKPPTGEKTLKLKMSYKATLSAEGKDD